MVRASELPEKFLNLAPIASLQTPTGETSTGEIPAFALPPITPEQRASLARLQGDLRWLVTEGYVTEFIDGRLIAPPPITEAKKKEAEAAENDPENFPEATVSTDASAPKPDDGSAPESASGEPAVEPAAPAAEVPAELPADPAGSDI
jgi:hypothetical protein